jgi:hypothetical protein
MLLTQDGAGLRRSALCHLKVAHTDSQRMVLRVERGKGMVDCEADRAAEQTTSLA